MRSSRVQLPSRARAIATHTAPAPAVPGWETPSLGAQSSLTPSHLSRYLLREQRVQGTLGTKTHKRLFALEDAMQEQWRKSQFYLGQLQSLGRRGAEASLENESETRCPRRRQRNSAEAGVEKTRKEKMHKQPLRGAAYESRSPAWGLMRNSLISGISQQRSSGDFSRGAAVTLTCRDGSQPRWARLLRSDQAHH